MVVAGINEVMAPRQAFDLSGRGIECYLWLRKEGQCLGLPHPWRGSRPLQLPPKHLLLNRRALG